VNDIGHITTAYRQPDPPPNTCVWGCGRRDFNAEHIVGLQVAKAMNTGWPLKAHWGDYETTFGKEGLEIVLVDAVCKGCNNGWMRKLDNRMMCFMGDTVRGDTPVTLTKPRQTTLAYWASKIALLFLIYQYDLNVKHQLRGMGPFAIPYDNLHAVWKYNRAPKQTRVWVGARDRRDDVPFIHHDGTLFQPAANPHTATVAMDDGRQMREAGYRFLFTIQRLVFVVWGWYESYEAGELDALGDPNEIVPDSMLPIWPADARERAWPPPHCLTSEEVAQICGTEPEWVQQGSGTMTPPEQSDSGPEPAG
jgi:hypothetical protein